jgi:hypothetical protein
MFVGCKNAPFVLGDREGAAGGQPCHAEPQRSISTPSTTDPSLRLRVTSEGGSRRDHAIMLPVHLAHSKQLGHAPVPGG